MVQLTFKQKCSICGEQAFAKIDREWRCDTHYGDFKN